MRNNKNNQNNKMLINKKIQKVNFCKKKKHQCKIQWKKV